MKKLLFLIPLFFIPKVQASVTINGQCYNLLWNPFTNTNQYVNCNSSSSLAPGSTNYIQNTNTLQMGATLYITSGTIGTLNYTTLNPPISGGSGSQIYPTTGTKADFTYGFRSTTATFTSSVTIPYGIIVTTSSSPTLDFHMYTGTSPTVTINGQGLVGINQTFVSHPLDVNGVIAGNEYYLGSSERMIFRDIDGSFVFTAGGDDNLMRISGWNDTNTISLGENATVFNGAFVGIGPAEIPPTHQLEVQGSVYFNVNEDPDGFTVYDEASVIRIMQFQGDTLRCLFFPDYISGSVLIGTGTPSVNYPLTLESNTSGEAFSILSNEDNTKKLEILNTGTSARFVATGLGGGFSFEMELGGVILSNSAQNGGYPGFLDATSGDLLVGANGDTGLITLAGGAISVPVNHNVGINGEPDPTARFEVFQAGPNGTTNARAGYNITGNDSQFGFYSDIDGGLIAAVSAFDGGTGNSWAFWNPSASDPSGFAGKVKVGDVATLPQLQFEVDSGTSPNIIKLTNDLATVRFVLTDESLTTGNVQAETGSMGFVSGQLPMAKFGNSAEQWANILLQTNNRVGASVTQYNVGGTIYKTFVDTANATTVETDLYRSSITAGSFFLGDGVSAFYSLNVTGSATATSQIKVYFGTTTCFDSGALSLSSSGNWQLRVELMRSGSSTARASVSMLTPGAALSDYTSETDIGGFNWGGNDYFLKVSGTRAGVGAGSSQIVGKHSKILYEAAPPQ